jgi:cyanophycinase-like exopeptidase
MTTLSIGQQANGYIVNTAGFSDQHIGDFMRKLAAQLGQTEIAIVIEDWNEAVTRRTIKKFVLKDGVVTFAGKGRLDPDYSWQIVEA